VSIPEGFFANCKGRPFYIMLRDAAEISLFNLIKELKNSFIGYPKASQG